MKSINSQMRPPKIKARELNKSAGILDDFAVRKNVATREGTIEKVPVNDSDIVNKKFLDDNFLPLSGGTLTGVTTLSGALELDGTTPQINFKTDGAVICFLTDTLQISGEDASKIEIVSDTEIKLNAGANETILSTQPTGAVDLAVATTKYVDDNAFDPLKLETNIILNSFRITINGSLSTFQMQDGVVDEYEDETGIDTTASTGELYDATGDYYSPISTGTVEYLVVGGGGGGASSYGGAGGGAGGYQAGSGHEITTKTYTITVGAGGAAETVGSNSVFDTITANGGGRGGSITSVNGGNGGSGGGGASHPTSAGTGGTGSQGNNGGSGNVGAWYGGSGGGGASAVGVDGQAGAAATNSIGGNGGDGTANSISGSSVTYAGGGAGAQHSTGGTDGTGGAGGGGNVLTAGTANTGGGGGGAKSGGTGGAGGSGIVIIRYLTASATATGGTKTTDGDYTVHTFTSSGDFIVSDIGEKENMILISNEVEAEETPTDGKLVILQEDVDAITINTDIKGWVSRDDGTTYTQLTLADEGDFDSTKKILVGEADISAQPSDKTMKYKITTHNNKNLKLHATGLLWD